MRISAKAKNLLSFAAGLLIAAALFITPISRVDGARESETPISGVTIASEVIRESRFKFLGVNGDGYLGRDEIPESDEVLRSMFTSLDENGDGRLSEPEYVLNGKGS